MEPWSRMALLRRLIATFILLLLVRPIVAGDNFPGHLFDQKFKSCKWTKDFIFLSSKQKSEFSKALEGEFTDSIIQRFLISCDENKSKKSLFVFNSIIRSQYMSIAIITDKSAILDFDFLSFNEPEQYKPPKKWLSYFTQNKKPDVLTGATLTSHSIYTIVKKLSILLKYQNEKK